MPDFPYMKIANNNIFAAFPKGFLYPMFYELVRNRTCLPLHVVPLDFQQAQRSIYVVTRIFRRTCIILYYVTQTYVRLRSGHMTQEKGLLATTGSLKAEIIYKPSDIEAPKPQ